MSAAGEELRTWRRWNRTQDTTTGKSSGLQYVYLRGAQQPRGIPRAANGCVMTIDENPYAMVPVEQSEIGTEVQVERPDETVEAQVADRVLFKPEPAEQAVSAGPNL